jgi:hypothetical protein
MRQGAFALRLGKDRRRESGKMEIRFAFHLRRISARVRELSSNFGAAETQSLFRMASENRGGVVCVSHRHLLRFNVEGRTGSRAKIAFASHRPVNAKRRAVGWTR